MKWTDYSFDAGEVRLHVHEGPKSGPPMVLVHGATSSHMGWSAIDAQLAERWHLYELDLRGHNLSGKVNRPGGYHLSRFAADVTAFLRGRVKEPAVLFGHSLGALTVLLAGAELAAANLMRAIIAEDPPLSLFRPDGQAEVKGALDYFALLKSYKDRNQSWDEVHATVTQMNPGLPPEVIKIFSDEFFRLDPAFLDSLNHWGGLTAGLDLAQVLGAIPCPVLLLQADLALQAALVDKDVEVAQRCLRRVQVVRFPGAGHSIHVDQTQKTLAAVEAFTQFLV